MFHSGWEWVSCVSKVDSKVVPEGDFPGGTVDTNLSANARDMGLICGPGRFHMPQSN